MKVNISLITVAVVILISCTRQTDQEQTAIASKPVDEPLSCYIFVKNNDTIRLSFKVEQNRATGDLTYNFFEKDDNRGTIEGEMHGDTLYAIYQFQSEGISSEREVAFLKRGDTMVEGFGEINQELGKSTFKNRKMLYFESNLVLNKTACN